MSRHVAVIHRWAAPYADYPKYIDHDVDRVSYITTEVGARGVPAVAAGMALVDAIDDPVQVVAALDELERRCGRVDALIALKEDDLLLAADIRADRGLAGPRIGELTPFRDKLQMARAVAGTGERVPAFGPVAAASSIRTFGDAHGWPVVVKPRLGSSSAGVRILDRGDLAEFDLAPLVAEFGPHLVQAMATGTLLHVDGVYDGAELPVWRAARYLHTPLEFREGGWVGSVDIDDPDILAEVGAHTRAVLRGLAGATPTVFHLETFLHRAVGGGYSCTFLEVGARVGGAEIPLLWREVYGCDLMEVAFRLALGENDAIPEPRARGGEVGGLLLIAAPDRRPCEITAADRALGAPWAPTELYGEDVLAVGEVISDAAAYYEHVGGRYRFRGRSTSDVEAAIATVASAVTIRGRSIVGGPR